MKNRLSYLLVLFILLSIPDSVLAFSIRRTTQFLPIDSLSPAYIQSYITLKMKSDSVRLKINDRIISFKTLDIPDSTLNYAIKPFIFSSENENTDALISIDKLLSIENDSICVSASCQEFDLEKGWNVGRLKKIDSIYIGKNNIEGVIVPSINKKTIHLKGPSSY